jgi:4-amino-4-deoxy-L-arabinose transferase-like glycosyltransferase
VTVPRWERIGLIAVCAGALLRVIWLFVHPALNYVYSDMSLYVERAQRLATGGPLSEYDAFYPPGTHVLLAAPMALLGTGRTGLWAASALWCLMSCLAPLFAWRFARSLLGPAAGALTAAACALWPPFITYGGYFLSEIPALTFLLACLWLVDRAARIGGRRSVLSGLVAGATGGAALGVRPQLMLNVALAVAGLAARFRRHARAVGAVVVGAAAALAGVLALNAAAAGHVTGLSENGGINFFQGHCDAAVVTTGVPTGVHFYFGSPVASQRDRGRDYSFPTRVPWEETYFYGEGLRCIRRDGLPHVVTVLRNTADLTATTVPWPQVNERWSHRVVGGANRLYSFLLLPVALIGSVLLIRRRRRRGEPAPELLLLAHLALVLPSAIVFYGDPRFRVPYDFFGLALLAALVVACFRLNRVTVATPHSPTLSPHTGR